MKVTSLNCYSHRYEEIERYFLINRIPNKIVSTVNFLCVSVIIKFIHARISVLKPISGL